MGPGLRRDDIGEQGPSDNRDALRRCGNAA